MMWNPAAAQVAGENRLALVIGNATYKSSPLTNHVNDARLMELRFELMAP